MNCRDCTHFNLKDLAQRNRQLAKQGYGFCNMNKDRVPMAGCYCNQWEQASADSVRARETFWRSR